MTTHIITTEEYNYLRQREQDYPMEHTVLDIATAKERGWEYIAYVHGSCPRELSNIQRILNTEGPNKIENKEK